MGWNDHVDVIDIESEIRMEIADKRGLDEPIAECDQRSREHNSLTCQDCQFDAWVYDEALKRYAQRYY